MKLDWWTLGLQTINVLVLLWILRHFFFKPVADVIARRQNEIQQKAEETAQAKLHAEQERKALEAERGAVAAGRAQVLEHAHVEAQAAAAALLKQAQEDAAARNAATQAALERERNEAANAILLGAGELAADIVSRLLRRFPTDRRDECFIEEACTAIPATTKHDMQSGETAKGQAPVEIVSSAPLSAAAQEHAKRILSAILGNALAVKFSVDAALLAGVELHIDQATVANNLSVDLHRILEQLQRERDPA